MSFLTNFNDPHQDHFHHRTPFNTSLFGINIGGLWSVSTWVIQSFPMMTSPPAEDHEPPVDWKTEVDEISLLDRNDLLLIPGLLHLFAEYGTIN